MEQQPPTREGAALSEQPCRASFVPEIPEKRVTPSGVGLPLGNVAASGSPGKFLEWQRAAAPRLKGRVS